ncbi:uncharacterized protein J3R85_004806 [Psidium guajava]|nr:uncharacterized protein J3R85_004806 [Psidium guajava]
MNVGEANHILRSGWKLGPIKPSYICPVAVDIAWLASASTALFNSTVGIGFY